MPELPPGPPSRRAVLGAALAAGTVGATFGPARGAAAGGTNPFAEFVDPVTAALARGELPRGLAYPFTLGIASGDPTSDGVVLWTRLAPKPLAEDGLGGMSGRAVDVDWQVAEDPLFRRPVRTGTASAQPGEAYSVHVELRGLAPEREYFYRFRSGPHLSRTGRTRTAPPVGSRVPLNLAVTSCAHWEHGYFTAYRHIAEERPDLILHLGDYLYGSPAGNDPPKSGLVRTHEGGRVKTLTQFRLRHAQYKTDADLQAAHAAAPWIATIDDHEVANNWAGKFATKASARRKWERVRNAALQAYWEHMPLPASARPASGGWQLYRRLSWGALATFHVLDTRQYRDAPACGVHIAAADCGERTAAGRSMLGDAQEQWLAQGLASSRADWDLIAQQIFFSSNALPSVGFNTDTWDGYAAARTRLLDAAAAGGVRNLAVLTGDCHMAWAAQILPDFADPLSAPVGVELVATSITSNGNGTAGGAKAAKAMAQLPYLRFGDQRRGWIRVNLTSSELRADFQALPYVTFPGAIPVTAASFVVASGSPLLHQI